MESDSVFSQGVDFSSSLKPVLCSMIYGGWKSAERRGGRQRGVQRIHLCNRGQARVVETLLPYL